MRSPLILLAFVNFFAALHGQVILVGHELLNNAPITNVNIFVKQGSTITQSVNTKNKSEFIVKLDFGKDYKVYFQHPKCPVMHLELITSNIPPDKYDYRMQYELNIPFVYKEDEDIDTTVFQQPFHRIIFNGKNRMVDDSAYNNRFARSVLKKPEAKKAPEKPLDPGPMAPTLQPPPLPEPSILAGKVLLNAATKLPVSNKSISLLTKDGKVLKSTATNRFGAFTFANIMTRDVAAVVMDINESETAGNTLSLFNSHNEGVNVSRAAGVQCRWGLKSEEVTKLVDNNYTSNIGGKLVSSSPKKKQFFADRNVYLSNKMNTVLKKTKTNLLGTFVFEDIEPDHTYFIGVDRADVAPGEKIDLLSKDDNYIATLDSVAAGRNSKRVNTDYNKLFNDLSIRDDEMKMDVVATIFGDNTNTPIGKLKIILLNDNYEVIDSALTNDFGTFKFKYLPFLKRFYLSAENTDNILDVFKNILIYSSDENLIKIMTHQKGTKFHYKPVSAELSRMRDVELDDPWLELIGDKPKGTESTVPAAKEKAIVENIHFESGKADITPQAKEILDKVILVLNTNKRLRIEIGAHTDCTGSEQANLRLSELRAKKVNDYIVAAGIDKGRLTSKGFGESRPMNGCIDGKPCSEYEYAQNRRIEFKILGD